MSDMDEMDEASAGTIDDVFCYLREQDPHMKTDYGEPIKYDPGLAPPEEVIAQLREVHKAIAMEEFDEVCALCFSMSVGEERYVCACRIRTIRPAGARPYQMLKAFIVTSTDLYRNKASALAIGTPEDWAELEDSKLPTMPVNIRKLNLKILTYTRVAEEYIQILQGVTKPPTVAWPELIDYRHVMHITRLALQKLPVKERSLKHVAIGLPKDVDLPLSLDLCIEQRQDIRPGEAETGTGRDPVPPGPLGGKSIWLGRADKLELLRNSLFRLRSAIETMPRREKTDTTGYWRLSHWLQVKEMNYVILALFQKAENGEPGALATRQAITFIRASLDQLQTECRDIGYSEDLQEQLDAVEDAMASFGASKSSKKSSLPLLERFQKWRVGLTPRSSGSWLALTALVLLTAGAGIKRIPWKTLIPVFGEDPDHEPNRNPDPGKGNTNIGTDNSGGDPQKTNPVTTQETGTSPPSNPLASSIEAYTPDAFDHLFPGGIKEKELSKIKDIYTTWARLPGGENKKKQRAAVYSAFVNTLDPNEKDQLKSVAPLLPRLKFTPSQWASLGPTDRLSDDQWDNIKRAAQNSQLDQDFKQEVKGYLTEQQRKIVGWTD